MPKPSPSGTPRTGRYNWKPRPRKCRECGKDFVAKGRQIACGPVCAAVRAEAQRRAWEQKNRGNTPAQCHVCGKPLAHGNARYCPLPAECRVIAAGRRGRK